jgi:hypothetical protein
MSPDPGMHPRRFAPESCVERVEDRTFGQACAGSIAADRAAERHWPSTIRSLLEVPILCVDNRSPSRTRDSQFSDSGTHFEDSDVRLACKHCGF